MVVARKPTPKGLEIHTVCCCICGILLWFEVWEGKQAMEKKEHCAEQKRKLGDKGPWRSVALTLRMVDRFKDTYRVVIADSWFGSVPAILALFNIGLFAVMNVKTAHKDYPKQALLDKLGYDKKTRLCPKPRRGESYGYSREYVLPDGNTCSVLAAGHNSKKPVLVVSTSSTMMKADDYTKTWTFFDALGLPWASKSSTPSRSPPRWSTPRTTATSISWTCTTTSRQGVVSMADVWQTKRWPERHFAEGLGFWEVFNQYPNPNPNPNLSPSPSPSPPLNPNRTLTLSSLTSHPHPI